MSSSLFFFLVVMFPVKISFFFLGGRGGSFQRGGKETSYVSHTNRGYLSPPNRRCMPYANVYFFFFFTHKKKKRPTGRQNMIAVEFVWRRYHRKCWRPNDEKNANENDEILNILDVSFLNVRQLANSCYLVIYIYTTHIVLGLLIAPLNHVASRLYRN